MAQLSILKKILLCLAVFVLGYVVVMVHNYKADRASEKKLIMVYSRLYPATSEAMQLKEQFMLQMKMFEESVVYGNEVLFDSASLKKKQVISHLESIHEKLGNLCETLKVPPDTCDFDELLKSYKAFITKAETQYHIILKNINAADTGEASKLLEQTETFERIFNNLYISLNETCKSELETVIHNFTKERKVSFIIVISVIVIAFLVVIVFIRQSLIQPIAYFVDNIGKISRGDMSVRFQESGSDEISKMGRALNLMAVFIEKRVEVALEIADGNLDVDVQKASENDKLGSALIVMVNSLNEIVSQINSYSDQVASGTMQIVEANQYVSKGAIRQSKELDEITGSMSDIENQINNNAEKAETAFEYANSTLSAARTGVKIMEEMTSAMEEINHDSKLISKIITTIDELAFQTNLLALNASVEAARAGKHGKGFAVVAQEVRGLAVKSAKAANETASLIENSKKSVDNGTLITEKTVKILSDIENRVTDVVDFISGIAVASKEQSHGISIINKGLSRIESVTEQNTSVAQQAYVSCQELSARVVQVRDMLRKFKVAEGKKYVR